MDQGFSICIKVWKVLKYNEKAIKVNEEEPHGDKKQNTGEILQII